MARIAVISALLVVAAVLIGCGSAKEYPSAPAREGTPVEQPEAVPTTSQQSAKDAFDKAVSVYTGGKPELVGKGKVNRTAEKGRTFLPVGNEKGWIQVERHLETVWPDRLYSVYEMKEPLNKPVATWIRGRNIWLKDGTEMKDVPNATAAARVATADAYAQRWLPLMLAALEPKAVAFDLQQSTLGNTPVQTMRLALPDLPIYKLTFDAKSYHLLRIEYTVADFGQPVKAVVNLGGHKLAEGLILPHTIESSRNGEPAEEWTVGKWEFPASIDDSVFSPKK